MLTSCGHCRRHVWTGEATCPFCGAAVASTLPRSFLSGRFSRAAVFAGLASCSGPSTPVNQPERTSQHDDRYDKTPAAGTGTVRGRVRDDAGHPVASFKLSLGDDLASTDADGYFTFENVAPGEHFLSYRVSRNPRHSSASRPTLVKAGAVSRVDIQLPPPALATPGSPKMPYGAPPARRRIV